MYAYDLHELRFAQIGVVTGWWPALGVASLAVPRNKLWTIIAAHYYPDAAETRTIEWLKVSGNVGFPLRLPATIALGPAARYPLTTEGNQLILLPGEYFLVTRDAATEGSSMIVYYQYVESDLPTMKYHDPQKLLSQDRRKRGFARGSILGSTAAAMGGHAGEGGEGGDPGGGEGGGIPV